MKYVSDKKYFSNNFKLLCIEVIVNHVQLNFVHYSLDYCGLYVMPGRKSITPPPFDDESWKKELNSMSNHNQCIISMRQSLLHLLFNSTYGKLNFKDVSVGMESFGELSHDLQKRVETAVRPLVLLAKEGEYYK